MKIELRTEKYGKKSWPFADQLEEARYDFRFIIPIWKWKIIKFIIKI